MQYVYICNTTIIFTKWKMVKSKLQDSRILRMRRFNRWDEITQMQFAFPFTEPYGSGLCIGSQNFRSSNFFTTKKKVVWSRQCLPDFIVSSSTWRPQSSSDCWKSDCAKRTTAFRRWILKIANKQFWVSKIVVQSRFATIELPVTVFEVC